MDGSCVYVDVVGNSPAFWGDLDCTHKAPGICSKIVRKTFSSCPDGWIDARPVISKCYYYLNDANRTWNDANLQCKALDPDGKATLTSIESPHEEIYLAVPYPDEVWLGGNDLAVEGTWR